MKKIYCKPVVEIEMVGLDCFLSTLSANADGTTILGDGGKASDNSVTEGDVKKWDSSFFGDDADDYEN
jgi:hypothetical protein